MKQQFCKNHPSQAVKVVCGFSLKVCEHCYETAMSRPESQFLRAGLDEADHNREQVKAD
jgi:hypothetical protein